MRCPRCGVEAAIMGTRTEVTGDRSPETETEVWTVLVYRCRNPNCQEYGKDVGETRHRIFPGAPAEPEASRGDCPAVGGEADLRMGRAPCGCEEQGSEAQVSPEAETE